MNAQEIRDRIAEEMQRQGVSQAELERRTGISQANISRYLKYNASNITPTAQRLLEAMGFEVTVQRKTPDTPTGY